MGKQGANLFPMVFGITPEAERPLVLKRSSSFLNSRKTIFDTGILATPMLLKVLTYNGQADLAYEVMNQKDFPGYGNYIIGENA